VKALVRIAKHKKCHSGRK